MKKIKFRGIAKCNAQPVFGDLVHYKGQIGINDYFVYPESVAQFIGYDCDGKEFYSDDTLIDSANIEIPVEELIIKYKEIGEHFYNFKLKG